MIPRSNDRKLKWSSFLLLSSLITILLQNTNKIQCVQRTTISTTTTIITQKCLASMEPKNFLIKQYENDDNIKYETIRCGATLTEESFTHPAFDLSFGDTSNTGLYIVRGIAKCQMNNTKCESEFRVPTLALKQLLLPSVNYHQKDAITVMMPNMMNHPQFQHRSSVIKITCDVADTLRNSKIPVRCTDSGSIRFAKVLQHGESCSFNVTNEECGHNMRCVNKNGISKCQCKQTFVNIRENFGKIICIEPATLGQKCIANQQCAIMDMNSLCQMDVQYGYKTCQCSKNFQIITSQYKWKICERIKTIPESSPITVIDESTFNYRQMLHSKEDQLNGTNSNDNSNQRNKISQLGLVVFFITLFWIIIILIFFIRYTRNKTKMDSELSGNQASSSNENQNRSIMGRTYKPQTDDGDVEVRIFDELELIRKGSPLAIIKDADKNSLNQAPNFDFYAKQTVI